MNIFKIILIAFFVTIGLVSCKQKAIVLPDPLPTDIISFDTMTMIMTDCYIAEGGLKQIQLQHENVVQHANLFYYNIFLKYKVTFDQYKTSLVFYHKYPPIAEEMYDIAIQNLSVLESEIKEKEENKN